MRVIKNIFIVVGCLFATLVGLMVAVQVYYRLTPVPLAADALRLEERAAALLTVTENGHRLYGMLAPASLDPVQYGRCLMDANDTHRKAREKEASRPPSSEDKAAYKAYWDRYNAYVNAQMVACLNGGLRVKLPKVLADVRIQPGVSTEQWRALAEATPDSLIVARAETVWAGGPRRLGASIETPIPGASPLMHLERWRTARAVQTWQAGQHKQAIATWQRSMADWVKSADGTRIDAMLSTAALSQVLLGIQDSVARADRIDDATAAAMLSALAPIDAMPVAVTGSILVEWQVTSALVRSLPTSLSAFDEIYIGLPENIGNGLNWAGRGIFDVNDTLNHMAQANMWAQSAVLAAAQGDKAPDFSGEADAFGCSWLGDASTVCLPFVRNPVGRILATVALPSYAKYGTRVADLRNLAAATRLTVNARRRGLSGDALAQFVAGAGPEMRDVFSKQPFVYDPATKRMRVELRERSTVLGEKGYELAL